jgi:3-hydroxyacyl-[acyl-carrier-protein] dehydratase
MLPQQPPFRFLDSIIRYTPGHLLQALFDPSKLQHQHPDVNEVPISILIEGLAQTAVIFVQLEIRPLSPDEIPLLGNVKSDINKGLTWENNAIFEITPVRFTSKHFIVNGTLITEQGERVLTSSFSISIADRREMDR